MAIDFGNMETTTGQVLLTIVGDDQTTDTVIINRYARRFRSYFGTAGINIFELVILSVIVHLYVCLSVTFS